MKKILTIALTLTAIVTFTSCQSTKTKDSKKTNNTSSKNTITISSEDDYDAPKKEAAEIKVPEPDTLNESVTPKDLDSTEKSNVTNELDSPNESETQNDSDIDLHDKLAPKKPQGFGQKFTFSFNTKKRHIEGDNITLFTKGLNGKITQQDMLTYYHTKNDMIGFGGNYYAAYYIMFFDEKNYNLLENCYKLYLSDFENHKLDRKSNKSFKAYGKLDCTLNWGTLKNSVPNFGSGVAYVGYTFIENKAFFTIQTKEPFYNEYSEITESAVKESITVSYYFTKSQMENMLKHTNREYMYYLLCKDMVFSEIEDMDSY